jgi:hypothetical protein
MTGKEARTANKVLPKAGLNGFDWTFVQGNSTYPKVAVQWLNQALCFYQSLCLVDSEVLRNRHLRVAANR